MFTVKFSSFPYSIFPFWTRLPPCSKLILLFPRVLPRATLLHWHCHTLFGIFRFFSFMPFTSFVRDPPPPGSSPQYVKVFQYHFFFVYISRGMPGYYTIVEKDCFDWRRKKVSAYPGRTEITIIMWQTYSNRRNKPSLSSLPVLVNYPFG